MSVETTSKVDCIALDLNTATEIRVTRTIGYFKL